MTKELKEFDLLILGGGPAGMTAAIYGARANLRVAIIEREVCGGLVNSTWEIENFPSQKKVNGMALMEMFQEQTLDLGVEIEEVAEIENISLEGDTKEIETDDYIYKAPAVILTTGRKPVELGLDVECEQIHYCSVCDGAGYKGKKLLVVGGGNSGFDESLYLLNLGVEHILLVEQMDRFFAAEAIQDRLFASDKVVGQKSTFVKELVIEDRLKAVVLGNTETDEEQKVEVDGVFVFMGQKPNTTEFNGAIELDKQGYILANGEMETNLPGVYAAGDVIQKKFRQITTAMSDGTIAALNAESYIRKQK
jgi:thioredoxin reductase (NADPH)